MSIEETNPSNPPATEAGTAAPAVQTATSEAQALTPAAQAATPETEMPTPATAASTTDTAAAESAAQAAPEEAQAPKPEALADAPAAASMPAAPVLAPTTETPKPSPENLPLPDALQAIDDQIRAALIMVAHGNARLSKLAGNIRFSYLQRDESQLIAERKKLKTAFQQGECTEVELKPGLEALLQKAESQAGKLIAPPAKVVATDADAPTTPLPAERVNQIRRALREAMMSLAAAAPLHLQIELAPGFSELEPDIMAMAARIHALHRQVLGSLKSIRWTSPTTCTLVFDNGKDNKEVEAVFGEQGLSSLPDEYRQNQKAAPGSRPAGQGRPAPRRSGAGGKPGQRPGGANGARQARSQQGGDGANAGDAGGRDQKAHAPGKRPQGQHRAGAGASDNQHQHGRRPPKGGKGPNQHGDAGSGAPSNKGGQGRPHGKRPHGAQAGSPGRRAEGQDQRGNRGHKSFPSNSAMADKLKAALGGLKLSGTKKD
ncbi:MAG: hypothetical protein Q4D91_05970 [Lautropia sp.]|nr:hypothetical protein [Lautropia sp.]